MRNRVENFITPLSSDPDLAYRESLLNTMLVILIGTSIFFEFLTIVLWVVGTVAFSAVIGGLALLLIFLLAYRLSRQQQILSSAYLTIGTLFLTILMITVFSGIGHPNILGFAIVAMMAAVLLGMKAAFLCVLLIVIAYGLCGYAQVMNKLPGVMRPEDAWLMDLSGMGIGLIALAFFGRIATKTLYTSLHRERDLTAKLKDQSSQLEEIVTERTANLTRTNAFLSALGQIAARVGMSADLDQILTTLDDELKKLDLHYFFVVHKPEVGQLVARYVSIDPKVMRVAEKMAGVTFDSFRLSLEQWPSWDEIKNGRGVCVTNPAEAVSDIFPNVPLPVLHPIVDMVGAGTQTTMIFLPLQVEQHITGILTVWGNSLTREDVPTLAIFANQLAVTLEKNRLYQETAALKRFNESIVQGVTEVILLEGAEGQITFANAEVENLLGYAPEELIGKHWTLIVPEADHAVVHQESAKRRQGIASRYEMSLRSKTDELVPVMVSGSPIFDGDDYTGALVAMVDITQQKQTEAQVKASLKEKEVLLQEIHHRVKNNLQVISSMLTLQSAHVSAPEVREIFKESHQRIHSMALIHEKLYRSENLASIDLAEYINDLSVQLFRSYQAAGRGIELDLKAGHIRLDINTAVPCGLILNELISNALKHAFPRNNRIQPGKVLVRVESSKDQVSLSVADNGIGFPEDIDFRRSTSFGFKIVNALVSQLHGTIELDRENGTVFQIEFPVDSQP